jgi:hypothetical protein
VGVKEEGREVLPDVYAREIYNLQERYPEDIMVPHDELEVDRELIAAKVPSWLADLSGFFSKSRSRKLPPATVPPVKLELRKPFPFTQSAIYRTPPALAHVMKEAVYKYLADGFIYGIEANGAAPAMLVPKGKQATPRPEDWRFCCDYRITNTCLKPVFCPMPLFTETIERLSKAQFLTKIDIRQAFHRLPVDKESQWMTAFKCRYGTFAWRVLPFGLQQGPAYFQQYINQCLGDALDCYATAYADDVLIYSEDWESHKRHVREVVRRLDAGELQGDIKKSALGVKSINYLGMIIDVDKGVSIHPDKLKAIREWTPEMLKNRRAVRSFLGMINYVRTFYKNASEVELPLNKLLRKDTPFYIGPAQKTAMEELKRLATSAPALGFYNPGRPLTLETDASNEALGAVLLQEDPEGRAQPLGFFSKTLSAAEAAYPIQDKELLAIIRAVQFWRPELTATNFTIVTDHEAIKYYTTKRVLTARQARWAQIMSEFDYIIRYRPGKMNTIADALSRKSLISETEAAKRAEEKWGVVIEPSRIPEGEEIMEDVIFKPKRIPELSVMMMTMAEPETVKLQGWKLYDAIIEENKRENGGEIQKTATGKLVVPKKSGETWLRTILIREAHEPPMRGHSGREKTLEFLSREYHWDGMRADVYTYVRNCLSCRRNKIPRDKTPGLLHPIEAPEQPWYGVVIDGKDMPQDRRGYNYVWAFICRLSKFLVTIPGRKEDTAEKLATRYFSRLAGTMGIPARWYTDRGPQFRSQFLAILNKLAGIEHRFGTAGQAATQGAVEITNQYLDQRLRFYVNHTQDDWSDYLPALDMAHNHSAHDSLEGLSPFEVMFGRAPRSVLAELRSEPVRQDMETLPEAMKERINNMRDIWEQASKAIKEAQDRQARQANRKRREPDFIVGDMVMVSKRGWLTDKPSIKLDSPWAGPYKILEAKGYSYLVDLPDSVKTSHILHASRLRKAPSDPLPGQNTPPPPPLMVDKQEEWEVEKVLAARVHRGRLQYQVEWRGWDPDLTFYNAEGFKHAPVKLLEFHEQ